MAECPDVVVLESGEAADHVAGCASCRVVVDLLAERKRGRAARDGQLECAKFELLLAARDEGTIGASAGELLDAHLRECADCRAVAATGAPIDRPSVSALPGVPSAAYALGREIGRGGMGRVIAAEDLRIGRPVALKELVGKAPSMAARFEREARVTARLQHPGIVPIYEIGTWPDGTPFYAMRIVEGQTLGKAIASRNALDERLSLLPAVIAAAEAVAFAHGKRILHRDLTPNNILVGEYGDTVVIDWGLAKDLAANDDDFAAGPYRDEAIASPELTRAGAVIGTAAYMPPEQARGESVDERADVYALGAILYHVLAGAPPYRGSKSEQVIERVLREGPPPLPVGAPRDLTSIVAKAMSRDATSRYRHAGELAAELRRFQTGRLVEAHHYSRGERVRRWLGAHRVAAAAALAIVAAGSVGLVGVLRERDRAEAGERTAIEQRTATANANAYLLEENGRQELLAGHSGRAAAWLSAAYTAGDHSRSLRFLLARAMHDVEAFERDVACDGAVNRFTPSPDGKLIAVSCVNAVLLMALDGKVEGTLKAPGVKFGGVVWSHDASRVVSWGADGRVHVWDVASRSLARMIAAHDGRVLRVSISPDDRELLTSGLDQDARLWDLSTGKLVRSFSAAPPSNPGLRADFIDARRIVTGNGDGELRTFDVATGTVLHTMQNHALMVSGDWDFTRSRFVVCGLDGSAHLWDLDTGTLVRDFKGHIGIAAACSFSRDHRRLLTSGTDGTAHVWDVATGEMLTTTQLGGIVWSAVWSDDGKTFVTAQNAPPGIQVWDAATGVLLGGTDEGGAEPERLLAIGDRIYGTGDRKVQLWRGLAHNRVQPFHIPDGLALDAAANESASRVILRDETGLDAIYDAESGARVGTETFHRATRPGNKLIAATDNDGIRVIAVADGRVIARGPAHGTAVEMSPDDRRMQIVDNNATAIWDIKAEKEIARFDSTWRVSTFSRDGERITAYRMPQPNQPPYLEVWQLSPPRPLCRIEVGRATAHPIAFDRTGSRLAVKLTESYFGGFVIWDVPSAREVARFATVGFVEVEPTGVYAAVTNPDRADVIELSSGRVVGSMPLTSYVDRAATNSDASLLAIRHALVERAELVDLRSARTLLSLPVRNKANVAVDNYQVSTGTSWISEDSAHLVAVSERDVLSVDIVQETRTPQEIAAAVVDKVAWRVEGARLVGVEAPTARVHGIVTYHGNPVAGASVAIVRDGFGEERDVVVTDASGRYELRGVPLGRAAIDAQSDAVHAFVSPHPLLLKNADEHVDLDLELDATIAGHLGKPGALVHAECDGDAGDGIADANGNFTVLSLRGGCDYTLSIDGQPAGVPVVHVADGKSHVTGIVLP